MRFIRPLVILSAVVLAAVLVLPSAVRAAPGDVGYQDQSFSGTGTPTGIKRAESVLWWNDGFWWANMWDTVTQDFHIMRLNLPTQTWQDTGVAVDTRANTHSDVLWDGTHLYVASHQFVADEQPAVSGYPSYLFRFTYNTATKKYALDSGFPVQINNMRTETLVIARDSTGKLWATWQQQNTIYLNRTNGDDRLWGVPFALPNAAGNVTGNVTVDDNSALVAFAGNKIGLMWSNQSRSSYGMFFAVHQDGAADTAWSAGELALSGALTADDHINLKSDSSGRVFAATKTSNVSGSTPLIMLLVRGPAGTWSRYPVAQVSDCPNRPLVLIDEQNGVAHAFYTAPGPPNYTCNTLGGSIYKKTSSLSSLSFPPGRGTPVIVDAGSPVIQDASSTKQNVNGATGLVVLAVNNSTRHYWHHYEPASAPPPSGPPVASFSGSPTSGIAPLKVAFTDTSTGSPALWSWTFGDGATSTAQHPSHTYASAGTYSVTLRVTNASGSNTLTKTDYITVAPPPPDFSISVSPAKQTIHRGGSASYLITLTPSNGFTGQVTLSVSGQPAGATTSFSQNPVTASTTASSTLSVSTTALTKQGGNTLTITATSGALTHTATVTLLVKR